jgi:glycosyltransferase involved in cell wall biosynthesis
MRIVQIIDSLEIGGAEKMAVNYANALVTEIEFSGLITTRKEGDLRNQIHDKVNYCFLKKKSSLDFAAAFRLVKYYKTNKIDRVHCHSSSYFTALLAKFLYPKMNIIWHDHNGLSEYISTQNNRIIQFASCFFKGIIVVNYQLKNWAETKLYCNNVIYLPNFTEFQNSNTTETSLKGKSGKRILCLANLRPQKNHFLLLEVALRCKEVYNDWTFHLVGKDFEDDYSLKINEFLDQNKLNETVFLYGSKNDISHIINQCDIAVFTSNSEGLPVSLIELGWFNKPVVSTKVGEIPFLISHGESGFLVEVNEGNSFFIELEKLILNEDLRLEMGSNLKTVITQNYTKEIVIHKYLNWVI